MWWFRRRRRREPPPSVLPALDRLAELVERVVALLDASAPGGLASTGPEPAPGGGEGLVHSVRTELVAAKPEPAVSGWVAFVSSSSGYRLLERAGEPPGRGDLVELEGSTHRVRRLAPSPLPGDRRPCAWVEREEPPAQGGNGHG